MDGDGHADVVVANTGQSRLWLGDGQGRFQNVTNTHLPPLRLTTRAAVLGDGDGDLDLILADAHGPNRLLLHDGSGRFTLAPETNLPARSQVSIWLWAMWTETVISIWWWPIAARKIVCGSAMVVVCSACHLYDFHRL